VNYYKDVIILFVVNKKNYIFLYLINQLTERELFIIICHIVSLSYLSFLYFSLVFQQNDATHWNPICIEERYRQKKTQKENRLIRLHRHSHQWPLPPNLLLLALFSSASTSAPAALALVHFFFQLIFNDFISFFVSLNWIMNCVAFYAGLFDEEGKLLGSSSSPIQIWKDGAFVEVTWLWLVVINLLEMCWWFPFSLP